MKKSRAKAQILSQSLSFIHHRSYRSAIAQSNRVKTRLYNFTGVYWDLVDDAASIKRLGKRQERANIWSCRHFFCFENKFYINQAKVSERALKMCYSHYSSRQTNGAGKIEGLALELG